jgi:hypothetical protein
MAVGILDTHLIHTPRAQRRRLNDARPFLCPLVVQLVHLICRVDVEMKPSPRRPLALLRQNELNLSASNESKSRSTRLPRRQEPLLLIRPGEPEPEAENIDVIRDAARDAIDTQDGPTTKQTTAVGGTHSLTPSLRYHYFASNRTIPACARPISAAVFPLLLRASRSAPCASSHRTGSALPCRAKYISSVP